MIEKYTKRLFHGYEIIKDVECCVHEESPAGLQLFWQARSCPVAAMIADTVIKIRTIHSAWSLYHLNPQESLADFRVYEKQPLSCSGGDWMRTVSIAKARGLVSPGGGATFSYGFSQCRLWSPSLHVPWSPWEQKSWCESPFAQKSASLGTWPISLSMFLLVKHPDLPGTLLNGSNLNHILKPWIVLFQTNKRFSPRD